LSHAFAARVGLQVDVSRETGGLLDGSLRQLARRFGLDARQCEKLAQVLAVLAADSQAPSAVTAPERAVDVHIADSLVGLEVEQLYRASRIADIGAGAGFPGLPLAIALPQSEVTLVDSQTRKCAFLERVTGEADLQNAKIVCARVEEWPEGMGAHECVLARALGPQPVVLEYAAPLLAVGGVLIDWRGERDPDRESAALAAAEQLGMERVEVRSVQPYADAHHLHLHVFVKSRETPDRFPRRVGIARKRPLA
jgi:16S rRNA (guanine527-N7)-methyltransferase